MIHTRQRMAALASLCLTASLAVAQDDATASLGSAPTGLWALFVDSFDVFSVVLIAGSLTAVGVIVRVIMEVRPKTIAPPDATTRIHELTGKERIGEVREFCKKDGTFVSIVMLAAIEQSARGRDAIREAAEFAATQECARWFRKIELLNVIGNLGPLVGLAGTVWGMVIAFSALQLAGGDAGPTELSGGIAKALFHTLLGLVLAIPCLLVFGVYRSIIDRVCTRAMGDSARLIERIPTDDAGAG